MTTNELIIEPDPFYFDNIISIYKRSLTQKFPVFHIEKAIANY
ncbi:MAG: hypothetical protein QNJ51_12225 [Calothrix sp. MO_167.B12]|nr:hypothetical protein [Calothrix sp. MO_167.B12]